MEEVILSKLIDEQSNGLILLNEDLVVLYANKKIREFFSSETNQLLGNYIKCNNTIVENTYCQQTSKCGECVLNNTIKQLKQTNNNQCIDNLKFNSQGEYINISVKIHYISKYIVLEFTDLCKLYEEINLLSRMMDKSKDIMCFKDNNLKYKYVNKSCAELFGCEKSQIINKDDEELLKLNYIDKLIYKQLKVSDEKTIENKYFNQVMFYKGRHLNISKEKIEDGILCIGRDITEEINANKRAETDVLTGLFNRRKFIEDLNKILKYNGDGFYLSLIDIDNLKEINDNYDHLKGDKYLKTLGRILINTKNARFYRTGGDEFAGIIRLSGEDTKLMFNDILKTLRELNYNPPLTISIGISKIDTNKTYAENYKNADDLLYKVKKKGKNNFILS